MTGTLSTQHIKNKNRLVPGFSLQMVNKSLMDVSVYKSISTFLYDYFKTIILKTLLHKAYYVYCIQAYLVDLKLQNEDRLTCGV